MQDVDYELVYEPGKDEADPLDYLSRHPLPETGHDKTEEIIRWNMNAEHALVITRIRDETQKDEVMQRLAKRITEGDWEKHKRDKDLKPYLHVPQEASAAEGHLQRTPNSTTTSTTEEGGQTRTQPRTFRKNQDQANAEGEILVPTNKQPDRHGHRQMPRVPSSYKRKQRRTNQGDQHPKPTMGHIIPRP